jgi:putative tryptophan/tyrosine transport system substrate-binding protein
LICSSSRRVCDADEILRAFDTLADYSSVGVIVLQGPVILYNRLLIIRLSDQHRLPTIYPFRYFAEAGGLVSYGVNPADPYHRAATYVDRILKGEKAGRSSSASADQVRTGRQS